MPIGKDAPFSVTLKSHDSRLITKVIQDLIDFSKDYQLDRPKIVRFPMKNQVFTVIRSPHVHKKSREQFKKVDFKASLFFYPIQENYPWDLLISELKQSKFRGVQFAWKLRYSTPLEV